MAKNNKKMKTLYSFGSLLILTTLALVMSACSTDRYDDEYCTVRHIIIETQDMESLDDEIILQGRNQVGGTVNAPKALWENIDTLGIIPDGGFQIPFIIDLPDGATSTTITLDANGWRTKIGSLYAAYYPFDFNNRDSRNIPWDGRVIQKQVGNNNNLHISKYWFYATTAEEVDPATYDFHMSFKNFGSVMRANFFMPSSMTCTRVIIVAQNDAFRTFGYYDLFDLHPGDTNVPTINQPLNVEEDDKSNHIILDLENCNTLTSGTNNILATSIYVPEASFEGTTLIGYVWDDAGNCYKGTSTLSNSNRKLKRNAVAAYAFASMTLTTTPYTNLKPWETEEDLCPTCTPVAF